MRQYGYFGFPNQRRFGVELEVSNNVTKQQIGEAIKEFEKTYKNPSHARKRTVKVTSGYTGWAQTKKNAYWHVKYDSTCGPIGKTHDFGWEIASYIGSGIDDVNHISRLARFLNNFGIETNTNCGLHVHVESNDFSPEQMGIMLARWLKIESFLISICHSSRKDNEFCRPIRSVLETNLIISHRGLQQSDLNDPYNLWTLLKPMDLGVHSNADKKVTLNTVGFAALQKNPSHSRPTVELRLPEALLDEIHVKNWIRLIINFVDKSKYGVFPRDLSPATTINEVLMYLGLLDQDNFAFLDSELQSTKIWFLNKIINSKQNLTIVRQAKKHFDFATLI